jgi:hypothetical protein
VKKASEKSEQLKKAMRIRPMSSSARGMVRVRPMAEYT